eukprot:TRINITY_DN30828_c0_g1_i1.p1 TRINITY_DN30828_c0_g1~~TRINITY_DN30828_c0_g1_i1.p1  ORF type:complete len:773 (-),score=123.88 TRINITY_DN30828_c0_g1_i1:146-2464(-)
MPHSSLQACYHFEAFFNLKDFAFVNVAMDVSGHHSIQPMLQGSSDARVAESAAALEAATARLLAEWQSAQPSRGGRSVQVARDYPEPEQEQESAFHQVRGTGAYLPGAPATAACEKPVFGSTPTSDFEHDLIERIQFHLDADREERQEAFDRLESLLANMCAMLEASVESSGRSLTVFSGGKEEPKSDGAVYAARETEASSLSLQGWMEEKISLLQADIRERADSASLRGVDARMREMEVHIEALPDKVRDALQRHSPADGTRTNGDTQEEMHHDSEPEPAPLGLPDIEIAGVDCGDAEEPNEESRPLRQPDHPGFGEYEYKAIQEWDRGLKPVMNFVGDTSHLGLHRKATSPLDQVDDELGHCCALLKWWMTLEEPERSGCLADISGRLASLTPIIILLNSASIVYNTNWHLDHLNSEPTMVMLIVDAFFTMFYIVELGVKISLHRLYFFCNEDSKWNISDFVLVMLSILDWMGTIFGSLGVDLMFLRMLRLLKLSRALKAFRAIRSLEDLRLIMDCMLGSFFSLVWCMVFLGGLLMLFSLVFVQGVTNHLKSEEDPDVHESFLESFGSVQRGMLSLFAATSGGEDWFTYYHMLESVGQLYAAFFLFYIVFFMVAAWNIVTGLFVDRALKLAQPDLDLLARDKLKQDQSDAKDLQVILRSLDADGSGRITHDEVQQLVHDIRFRNKLTVLGIDIKDVDMFYRMLASVTHEDEVRIDAFVAGCMRLKGTACSLDLHSLCFQHQASYLVQKRFNQHLLEKLGDIQDRLEKKNN